MIGVDAPRRCRLSTRFEGMHNMDVDSPDSRVKMRCPRKSMTRRRDRLAPLMEWCAVDRDDHRTWNVNIGERFRACIEGENRTVA
jgi:hypothetical protein